MRNDGMAQGDAFYLSQRPNHGAGIGLTDDLICELFESIHANTTKLDEFESITFYTDSIQLGVDNRCTACIFLMIA
jgi:hypothetical protein